MLTAKWAIGGVALGALLVATSAQAVDVNAIDARLRALEAEIAKLRKEAKEAKAQAAAAASKATNVANAAHVKGDNGPPPPPPVFVSLKSGLLVETEDKAYAFKIGGRLFVDGGGTAGSPGNAWQSNVGFGQARLEVEGRMKPWFYKLQFDFANPTTQLWNTNLPNANTVGGLAFWSRNYVTDRNFLWGGWRDAYVGLQDPRLSAPWLAEPVYFKIGSQYESFSLEALASSKYRDTIERPLAVDAIAPFRHIGIAAGMIGKDNWTAHFGIYSLSFQDLNARPVNTSSGNVGVYVPAYSGYGVRNANWYQPWGGGAYWEATGRVTWAPIFDEHRLVHIGVAGSYHQPNSATAYSDDRNSAPGNRLGSEANVLGSNFLGTPDLSCGRFLQPTVFQTAGTVWNQYNAAGNCINNIEKLDLEAALSYNNFFVQGEWLLANYNRNTFAAAEFAQAQLTQLGAASPAQGIYLSPGNSRYIASGGYVQGEWWITGEEKSRSYDLKDKNGVTFGQLKIKNPFSMGGWGAWGLVGRWSVLNLNNGPFSGGNINNALFVANNGFGLFGPLPGTPAQIANATLLQNAIANSGIYGGYQQNITAGVNWYPDNGVAFQFNATHVLSLKSPLNWNPQSSYEGGSHPTFLEMRAKVYF
ncbi:porin [Methylocystis echinoides]|jgi:phosphate-selective porin OprO/OprP|uniref:OprO/OprP family phosphate-selective porin n=1 Tax=Methylocystis echinoides TaxID=29468 RepID=UPI00343C5BBE